MVTSANLLKRKDRNDRYGHRNETLQKLIAPGPGADIRLEGRPLQAIIISANLGSPPSKNSRDGVMSQ